ncbi:hypothetical protein I4U23_000443 [Adineta vaga]|nr:hypothetical protein I4U23_000443 [Adineta vaga]
MNNTKDMKSQPKFIKQTPSVRRSCLKHQTNRRTETIEPARSSIGTGRVSFANGIPVDSKNPLTAQSTKDLIEKKSRSDTFAKKAKELQLAELNYFKDHARDKQPNDE